MISSQSAPAEVNDLLQHAIRLHQAGKLADAEPLYRNILKQQPTHPDANHNMGVLAVQCGQPVFAIPFFQAALETDSARVQFWLSYIETLLKISQPEAAKYLLSQARQRELLSAEIDGLEQRIVEAKASLRVDYTLALGYRESGRFAEAAQWLQIWLAHHPEDADAYAHLAQILGALRQNEAADRAIAAALRLAPNSPVVLRNQARILLRKQDIKDALQAARQAFSCDANDVENSLVLAAALMANAGPSVEVSTLIDSGLQSQPQCAEALALRGAVKQHRGDSVGALADVESALAIKPHLTHLWLMVGGLRYRLNNLPGAVKALETALSREPDNPRFLSMLGEFKRQLGFLDEALALLSRALEIAADNAEAWGNYGVALQQCERISEAKTAYLKALKLDPKQVETQSNLGVILKNESHLPEAEAHLRRAIELRPSFADAHSNLGAVLVLRGRLQEAESSFLQAINLQLGHAEAFIGMGTLLEFLGRLNELRTWMMKGLEVVPDRPWRLASLLMICDWIEGRREDVLMLSQKYKNAVEMERGHSSARNLRIFFDYLSKLAEFARLNPDQYVPQRSGESTLQVIGESHSLALSGLEIEWYGDAVQAQSRFVTGIKMFHLSMLGDNHYKQALSHQISSLDKGAHVLICIGEIDCRPNEGIWRYAMKSGATQIRGDVAGVPISEVVNRTVDGYYAWLAGALYKFNPKTITIQGVPAPNYSLSKMTEDERSEFLKMIISVNHLLEKTALERGWSFLNVFEATADATGISHGRWHIDKYHLKPDFYGSELSKWIRSPAHGDT